MDDQSTPLKSRFLDVARRGDALTFSLQRCFDEHLGLRLRPLEVHRNVKSRLRSVGFVTESGAGTGFAIPLGAISSADVTAALENIDKILETIAGRPLTSRLVEQALGISAKERLRWTKDKRLPKTGNDTIRRGQVIAVSTYSVSEIERLIRDPLAIRAWREADSRTEVGAKA